MATLMCNITGKTARVVIWLLMLGLLFRRVYPFILSNSLSLWILIKRRKFIYIVVNFIIISILISSSSFTPHITNLLLKLHEKAKLQKLLLLFHGNNNQKVVDPCDDDTWWLFTPFDHEPTATTVDMTSEEEGKKERNHVEEEEEIIEEEEDSMDATWKAIMEAKGKESGTQLKKSDTWSYGDGAVDEKRRERVGLRKYRVRGELKKWQSSRSSRVEEKENLRRAEGGDGGGGGWRSVEVALTFHDELKKRADAFIARFAQDIHLQRLESDQRFLDMINRGL